MIITDIMAGIVLTDSGTDVNKMGAERYTEWLNESGSTNTCSLAASDSNWYDPDSVKIYLGVKQTQILIPE